MQIKHWVHLHWVLAVVLVGTAGVLLTGCPSVPTDPSPPQTLDDDEDGVINDDDQCPNTPPDTAVDSDGCPVEDPTGDDDEDGVNNEDDDCPDTPPGTAVDAAGCPIGSSTDDSDGDGVVDTDDDCPDTPPGATVDANGCSEEQLDDDGDGVPNETDDCPDTPTGVVVDENGCGPFQPDTDEDGVVDSRDACPGTPPGTTVGADGCPLGGGDPVCGNGVVEPGEQCEPPNTATCDANCLRVDQPDVLSADDCADADPLEGEGEFFFDNAQATMDGPAHSACVSFGEDQIDRDVWGQWTSPCTGTVFVRTCGLTAVDTKIAVYSGTSCPVSDGRLLSCNDDACSAQSVQSLVTFEAVQGQSYLIRLGTFPGEPGDVGGVEISCGLSVCPAQGDCLAEHGNPGCEDETCCERTCAIDPFCCDVEWDEVCASEAEGLCSGSFATCGGRTGSCSDPDGNGTPGCNDAECCNAVCAQDPFCCLEEWDDVCATQEAMICHSTCGSPDAPDCHTVHASPGCNSDACCAEVCLREPFCCQTEWDEACVDLANRHCK